MKKGIVIGLLMSLGVLGTMAVNLSETPKQDVGYFDDVVTATSPVFDVRAYEAKGDGTTDDTTAFVNALTAIGTAGGGTLYIHDGEYVLASASLDAMANDALSIPCDGVHIVGAGKGRTILRVTGSDDVGVFYANRVNHFSVSDLTIIQNSVGSAYKGYAVLIQNSGATQDYNDFCVERIHVENCQSGGWIHTINSEGAYGLSNFVFRDITGKSYSGNMVGDGDSGTASHFLRIVDVNSADAGWIKSVQVENIDVNCYYIKQGVSVYYGTRDVTIADARVRNSGQDKATDDVQSYGILVYGNCQNVHIVRPQVTNAWDCGIYCVSGDYITITDPNISGQVATDDATLLKGGIVCADASHVTIQGGTVRDCVFGMQLSGYGGVGRNIIVNGVNFDDCTTGIVLREQVNYKISGGMSVTGCHFTSTPTAIRIQRADVAFRLANLMIANNVIEQGYIYNYRNFYDSSIIGNRIYATDRTYGIDIYGGEGIGVQDNIIIGPGAGASGTIGVRVSNILRLSDISRNTITGFATGLSSQDDNFILNNNRFLDVAANVATTAGNDLGKEAPSGAAGSTTLFWRKGDFTQSAYPSTTGNSQGWLCTAPVDGYGCTYTTTTTGDMTAGESYITGIAAMTRYVPGVACTLANAAAGPATLSTEVLGWRVTYGTLSGTFTDGEMIEDTTSGGYAYIDSDNGTDTLIVSHASFSNGSLTVGNTIKGHSSGATAVISALALKVADACGNTVDDAVLSLVAPTWVSVPVTTFDSAVTVGADGTTQGILNLWDGSGGNKPGYIKIGSPNGTLWYLFIEDDGTVKIHNAVPTANADGDAVGDQTD